MALNRTFLHLLFIVSAIYTAPLAHSQCSAMVGTFPYNEGFEAGMGNWFVSPASINSDWAWGSPQKTIINSAGSGINCWITGGLTGNAYNNGEESFLQSPCFNLSSLQNPIITFKIFWETELNYDGGGFQYSTDGGNTWTNLGSANDNAGCGANYWFNNANIRYLSTVQGWSGNTAQGGGSGKWVTATHDLSAVKGDTSVAFRFSFGAGTRNNNYNGIAIDDIFIGESPTSSLDFSSSCNGNNQVGFTPSGGQCSYNYSWNFGDPSSGANNTSNALTPTHQYSSPGTYTITMVSNGITITHRVSILSLSIQSKNLTCNLSGDGSATAIVTGGIGNYTYAWSTAPMQTTSTISNISAGTYTVTVSAPYACPATQTVNIIEPNAISPDFSITNEVCTNKKGAIATNTTGGTPPYQYQWGNSQTTTAISNLNAGTYSLVITDANQCTVSFDSITLSDSITMLHVFLGNDTAFCPGKTLVLDPGSFAGYLWQNGSDSSNYTVYQTGEYQVSVTDSNGCTTSDSISVTVNCSNIFFPSAFTPNNDGLNDLYGPGGNLASVKKYFFSIYNRWGQLVFATTNPYQKWDGTFDRLPCAGGTFVWFATYSIDNNPKRSQKGTLVILR